MNHACNLIVSPFDIFQARFKEFGDVGLSSTLKVYKVFTKAGWGPWLNRKLCLGPASVINCTPLSTLSFWASLFPRAFGYSNAIQPSHSLSSPSAPALNWVLLRLGSSAEFMVNISIQNIIPFLVQNLFSSRLRNIKGKGVLDSASPCGAFPGTSHFMPCFLFAGKRLQLPRPSWIPKSRFKQALIREVRESRNNGGIIKKLLNTLFFLL